MRSYVDAKLMAKSLREILRARQIEISHSDGLEIVAQQFGFDNWNILAARIAPSEKDLSAEPTFQTAIPILRIFSIEKANEFYSDYLGFSLDWKHSDDQGPVLHAGFAW